jgi:hypothetical protein
MIEASLRLVCGAARMLEMLCHYSEMPEACQDTDARGSASGSVGFWRAGSSHVRRIETSFLHS